MSTPTTAQSLIGEGQHGKVYKESKDTVVKKTSMWNVKDMVGPFCLDHPNIVSVNKLSIRDNLVSISMERGQPCSKDSFTGDLPNFIKQVLAGLLYLHSNKIIHQDIKCNNIIKSGDIYKIIDFGLATLHYNRREKATMAGLHGAPEMMKNARPRFLVYGSDVYMLGVALRTMISDAGNLLGITEVRKTYMSPRSRLHQVENYVRYQHSVLGNGNELLDFFGLSGRFDLPDVTPVRFDDPNIESLVTMMTTVDVDKRPSVKELLAYPMFVDIPYRISESWYLSYPHAEPQYHSVVGDNRTNINISDIRTSNIRIYQIYICVIILSTAKRLALLLLNWRVLSCKRR